MIAKISGVFKGSYLNSIYIEVSGMTYEIQVSSFTLAKMPIIDEKVSLYTYMHVRENELSLYGFYSIEEKTVFSHLMNVSGVGPKLAITILSGFPLSDLVICIISNNTKLLSTIKGVGKKRAELIVLELKEKLANESISIETDMTTENSKMVSEALLALKTLGIEHDIAIDAINNSLANASSLEDLIFSALKNINR